MSTKAPPVGFQLDFVGGEVPVYAKSRRRLARKADPPTSHAAGDTIELGMTGRHDQLLDWLRAHHHATDDQMAIASVQLGICKRHEQGRRLVRTMREVHHLIVPAVDGEGEQIEDVNVSGRRARCWRAAT